MLTRAESLDVNASFDLLDERQSLPDFGVDLSKDKLRFVSLGLDWARAQQGSTYRWSAMVTQGIAGLGARDQGDVLASGALLSRMGSEPGFTRLNFSVSVQSPVATGVQITAIGRAQAGLSGALPASQQFSLDNPEGLSGYPLGTLNADTGITGRAELSHSALSEGMSFAPYLFAAGAAGEISRPTALERGSIEGWSAGGGLRAALLDHVRLHAELAQSHTSIFAKDDTRGTVRISFHF